MMNKFCNSSEYRRPMIILRPCYPQQSIIHIADPRLRDNFVPIETNMMKQAKEHAVGGVTRSPYIDGATAGTEVRAEHDAPQPKAHILIIDDEVLAREQLELFYTSKGYTVEIADSGQEGLNLLNNSRIDLVIVYTGLAGLSGAEVIDQLQRNHPGVSVIVTGYWAHRPLSIMSCIMVLTTTWLSLLSPRRFTIRPSRL